MNLKNKYGYTSLISCCNHNPINIKTVKKLLENKADVNTQDNDGRTALMHIDYDSNNGRNIKAIKLLLKYNANVNIQDNNGCTALMSCYADEAEIFAQLLLENNADINTQDNDGLTALMYWVKNACNTDIKFAKLLLKNNVDINLKKQ